MLSFLMIFGASLCGYAHAPIWAAGLAALGLASLSYHDHQRSYERGRALGRTDVLGWALGMSFLNATMAAGAGYVAGAGVRLVAGV